MKKLYEATYSFEKIEFADLNLEEFYSIPNKPVTTTIEWINFVIEESHAQPYIIRITKGVKFLGYFTSLFFKKMGIKFVGSPFPGWGTPFMGLDMLDTSIKSEVLPELVSFVIYDSKCTFIQIADRDISFQEAELLKKKYNYFIDSADTLELDINCDDNQMFKNMKTDCRNFIRQFDRRGASIELAEPNEEFVCEHYNQLKDVFAKQKLVPSYSQDKILSFVKNLSINNRVLCLRVRNPEGCSIATSIFPGYNKKFIYWTGASLKHFQHYRPNEYMIYTAMKYWRDKGCTKFDMMGIRPYKKKFGSSEVHYPVFIIPKYRILYHLKNWTANLYYFSGKVMWGLHLSR